MPPVALESLNVELVISDPWDFVTAQGSGPFHGKIIKAGADPDGYESMLIQLQSPILHQAKRYEFFVARPRYEGFSLDTLRDPGVPVNCGLIGLTDERAEAVNPLDCGWWRGGGVAVTGTLTRVH